MKCPSVKLIYFSPTRTTKKIVEAIAQGAGINRIEHLDLTPPEARTGAAMEIEGQLTIIGVPVYAGRVALEATQRLRRLKVRQAPAVVVVLYGNRAYEDALLELKDLAVEFGFIPVAAGAFIGEHSYDNKDTPIAPGRPDREDLKKASDFGRLIRRKLERIHGLHEMPPLTLPGRFLTKKEEQRQGCLPKARRASVQSVEHASTSALRRPSRWEIPWRQTLPPVSRVAHASRTVQRRRGSWWTPGSRSGRPG